MNFNIFEGTGTLLSFLDRVHLDESLDMLHDRLIIIYNNSE